MIGISVLSADDGDRLEQPEQAQADDEHETEHDRSAECMNGKRERPAPGLVDPLCVLLIGNRFEHVHSP